MIKQIKLILSVMAMASAASINLAAATFDGSGWPAIGGTTFAYTGGSAGAAGGWLCTYSGFDSSEFSLLYWAPQDVKAGLDNNATFLTFSGVAGNQASWTGSSYYDDYWGNIITAQTKFLLTLTPNGTTHLEANSDFGAVIDNSSGADYQVRFEFLASFDKGSSWVPMDPIDRAHTFESFSAQFYWNDPVSTPDAGSSLALFGLTLTTLAGLCRYRRWA